MEKHEASDEVQLPDEVVEDLEPTKEESDDVTGGLQSKAKPGEVTLTRSRP